MELSRPATVFVVAVIMAGGAVAVVNAAEPDPVTLCADDKTGDVSVPNDVGDCAKGTSPFDVASDGDVRALATKLDAITATVTELQERVSTLEVPERCKQALADAGLTPSADANYILGTDGDDVGLGAKLSDSRNDVVCGFGGNDTILTGVPRAGDIVVGGDGADYIPDVVGATFVGGAGDDRVYILQGGTFNGGAGNDSVGSLEGGAFNGGAGDDGVGRTWAGTFNGGAGNDSASAMSGGTFNGEDGCDSVGNHEGGTFNPGDQSTC